MNTQLSEHQPTDCDNKRNMADLTLQTLVPKIYIYLATMVPSTKSALLVSLYDPLNIFTYDIKFEIDLTPHLELVEVGMFIGIGNNRNRKAAFERIEAGQARPVDRDRSFFHRDVSLSSIISKVKYPAAILFCYCINRSHLIDMTLYNVSIKSPVRRHTPFQVHLFPHCPLAQIGLL